MVKQRGCLAVGLSRQADETGLGGLQAVLHETAQVAEHGLGGVVKAVPQFHGHRDVAARGVKKLVHIAQAAVAIHEGHPAGDAQPIDRLLGAHEQFFAVRRGHRLLAVELLVAELQGHASADHRRAVAVALESTVLFDVPFVPFLSV